MRTFVATLLAAVTIAAETCDQAQLTASKAFSEWEAGTSATKPLDVVTTTTSLANSAADTQKAAFVADLVKHWSPSGKTGSVHFTTSITGGADSNWAEGGNFGVALQKGMMADLAGLGLATTSWVAALAACAATAVANVTTNVSTATNSTNSTGTKATTNATSAVADASSTIAAATGALAGLSSLLSSKKQMYNLDMNRWTVPKEGGDKQIWWCNVATADKIATATWTDFTTAHKTEFCDYDVNKSKYDAATKTVTTDSMMPLISMPDYGKYVENETFQARLFFLAKQNATATNTTANATANATVAWTWSTDASAAVSFSMSGATSMMAGAAVAAAAALTTF